MFLVTSSMKPKVVDAITYAWGSKGQKVKTIQWKLLSWGYYHGRIDGNYGYKTYKAVKRFQAKNGITADGKAGPRTLAALGIRTKKAGTGRTGGSKGAAYNQGSVYLMAKAITGEARGEPYLGKVAVGAIILNRTRDSRFPSSIASVIYQSGAFTAVADGQINLDPDPSCLRAARDAMNGWDPTNGCVYYYNPATATNKWIWSRTVQMVIGKHRFAK